MSNYNSLLQISEYVQDNSSRLRWRSLLSLFLSSRRGGILAKGKPQAVKSFIRPYRSIAWQVVWIDWECLSRRRWGDRNLFLISRPFYDILITGQNTLEYTYEIGIGDEYNEIEHIENISFEKAESKLRALEEMKPCNSLEYSMQDGLIGMLLEKVCRRVRPTHHLINGIGGSARPT